MKRITTTVISISVLLTIWHSVTTGQFGIISGRQSEKQKIDALRGLLNLPNSSTITFAKKSPIAAASPIKIYVLAGIIKERRFHTDSQVYGNYVRWFDEWNRNDGRKYRTLEMVQDIAQSDVVLIRYLDIDQAVEFRRKHEVPVEETPIYYYIANYKPNQLEILFHRGIDIIEGSNKKEAGSYLRDKLFNLLKTRAKVGAPIEEKNSGLK